jgi:LysM repeat protein
MATVQGAMRHCSPTRLLILFLPTIVVIGLLAQEIPGKRAVLMRVEPGLENAVKWIWQVAPSDASDWGFSVPTPTPSPTPPEATVAAPEIRPTVYEVKQGDALILIGKKFGLTVEQLKSFNGLKNNLIRVGQKLKIPTIAEPRPRRSSSGYRYSWIASSFRPDLSRASPDRNLPEWCYSMKARTQTQKMTRRSVQKPKRRSRTSLPITNSEQKTSVS